MLIGLELNRPALGCSRNYLYCAIENKCYVSKTYSNWADGQRRAVFIFVMMKSPNCQFGMKLHNYVVFLLVECESLYKSKFQNLYWILLETWWNGRTIIESATYLMNVQENYCVFALRMCFAVLYVSRTMMLVFIEWTTGGKLRIYRTMLSVHCHTAANTHTHTLRGVFDVFVCLAFQYTVAWARLSTAYQLFWLRRDIQRFFWTERISVGIFCQIEIFCLCAYEISLDFLHF